MNIERAIRQFRAAQPEDKRVLYDLYAQIAQEIQRRLPDLRDRAKGGLSPKAKKKLQQYDNGELLSRLIQQLVEVPELEEVDMVGRRRRRGSTYDPVDGKFDSYASDHIRRFIKSQMKPDWTPLHKTPEPQTPPDRVPTNTLPMDKINSVIQNKVMEAMDSVTNISAETKILYAIDHMAPGAVTTANFGLLCSQAGLSEDVTAEIIWLVRERPDKYARRVEELLGISQSSARKRVDRAVPHMSRPLQDAMLDARKELSQLRNPSPDPNRHPFFGE